MRIHFIAIGGAAMHNLAIALHLKGYQVTGSDDEIFEPSRSRLARHGLLPSTFGWFPEQISSGIDIIILGMHARADNPELIQAQQLGLKIYSYPEFIYQQTKDKLRVVIGGSHGKTTLTSMIMHVLNYHQVDFDYMVGAQIEGFDTMVRLNNSSKIVVLEGDEYLSSPIDRRPKLHWYKPQIGLLTGIAWDHINVFPTFENYVDQFARFAEMIPDGGTLIWYSGDENLQQIAQQQQNRIHCISYKEHQAKTTKNETYLLHGNEMVKLGIFGKHNLQNINGAKIICNQLGISDQSFYQAIATFKGASRRLEVLATTESTTVFRDFAHSPSKLKATTEAVKEQFPTRNLIACMELHTFSSLQKEFLPHYRESMDCADRAIVFFDPHTIAHKKLAPITTEMVKEGFGRPDLEVFTNSDELFESLRKYNWQNSNLLLMSSGNYSGKDLPAFAEEIINQ